MIILFNFNMRLLLGLSIFILTSCSSTPKNFGYNYQITCDVGSRYYYFNLEDGPKAENLRMLWKIADETINENTWYIQTLSEKPDFNQKPQITIGSPKQNIKRYLQRPYKVNENYFIFRSFGEDWEINRINMKATVIQINPYAVPIGKATGDCVYGFNTSQFQ